MKGIVFLLSALIYCKQALTNFWFFNLQGLNVTNFLGRAPGSSPHPNRSLKCWPTNDFNPLFGWFLLGPEPCSFGSLVPDGRCEKAFGIDLLGHKWKPVGSAVFHKYSAFFSSSQIPVDSPAHLFVFLLLLLHVAD